MRRVHKHPLIHVGVIVLTLIAVFFSTAASAGERALRLATTTSTENSGLLKALLPAFERDTGRKVHVIAVGTGKALRLGENGDVDVVMVHAPATEQQFVEAGFGVNRRELMYNDFLLVGPKADPAGLRTERDAARALARLAERSATFVSRGDASGTHAKEKELWSAAGVIPRGAWYRAAGQGMEQVLLMAQELEAYALTDRGTWLATRNKLRSLAPVVEGDPRLFNPYGVMAVNPARYPDIDYEGAMALITWLTSADGQNRIARFEIDGEPLFVPVAVQARSQRPAAP